MSHVNYGTLVDPPEVIFGAPSQNNSLACTSKSQQLSESVSTNLFTIQSNVLNLEKALKVLGTRKDHQGFRDSLHVTQLSANQIINQTSQEIALLIAATQETGDRLMYLQSERLKSEFKKTIEHYSTLQKAVAAKLKTALANHSEPFEEVQSKNVFEQISQDKQKKILELKQAEIDQQLLIEREQRFRQIESDMIDVNQIMKELSSLIQQQGENINSIENNIERAYSQAERGRHQLEKAQIHQISRRRWVCGLMVFLSVGALIIAVVTYFELRSS